MNNPRLFLTPKRLLAIAVVLVLMGAIVAAIMGVQKVVERQQQGTLRVTTNQPNAELRLRQQEADFEEDVPITVDLHKETSLGTGSVTTLLDPGTYQVIAEYAETTASAPVIIKEGQTTDVNLSLEDIVKVTRLADVPARDILPLADGFNYLDPTTKLVMNYNYARRSSLELTSFTAAPANTGGIDQVHWFGPLSAHYRQGNIWRLVNGGNPSTIKLTTGATFGPSSVSANSRGQLAATRLWELYRADSPGQTPQRIASLTNANISTSIAPDGKVLAQELKLHTHDEGEGEDHPKSKVWIYDNGKLSEPRDLQGGSHFVWSPSSSKVTYLNETGSYVYDFTTKQSKPLVTGNETYMLNNWWLNDKTIAYDLEGAIWVYDTVSQTARKRLTYEGRLTGPEALTVGDNGNSLYFATAVDTKGRGGYVYKASL